LECVLARALLAEGIASGAKEAAHQDRVLAARKQNLEIRWEAEIAATQIEISTRDGVRSGAGLAAHKELATVIARVNAVGYKLLARKAAATRG
jgi:hypothetical protein